MCFHTFVDDVLGLRFCDFWSVGCCFFFIVCDVFGYLPYLGMSNLNINPRVKMGSACFVFLLVGRLCLSFLILLIFGYLGVICCVILGVFSVLFWRS